MASTSPPRPSPTRLLTAVALALLLLAPTVPFVLAQGDCDGDGLPDQNCPIPTPDTTEIIEQNPAASAGDFWVVQGEGRLYQSNFYDGRVPTYFADSGRGVLNVTIPIHNSRNAQPTAPVNVWVWLSDTDGRVPTKRGICLQLATINITSGTTGEDGNVVRDGLDHVYWPEMVISDLLPGGYNITYGVNTGRPSGAEGMPADVHCPEAGPDPDNRRTNNDAVVSVEANNKNNTGRIYFVKERFLDLTVAKRTDETLGEVPHVEWCMGTAPTCDTDPTWNVTVEQKPRPTWFKVVTENKGTWEDNTDYNCQRAAGVSANPTTGVAIARRCPPSGTWTYDLNVTIRGPLTTVDNTTNLTAAMGAGRSGTWNISDRAGLYTITVNIDPKGHLRQGADAFADTGSTNLAFDAAGKASPIEVKWRDYTANFTASDFRTTETNAYAYTELFIIEGNVTITNLGKAPTDDNTPVQPTPPGEPPNPAKRPVFYRIYLDNTTEANRKFRGDYDGAANDHVVATPCPVDGSTPCTTQLARIYWEASNLVTHPNYLPPGLHKIIIEVDNRTPNDVTSTTNPGVLEIDETNNRVELPIYIQDATPPQFKGAPKITNDRLNKDLGKILGPTADTLRAGENFSIHVNVTDNDLPNLDVVANVSYNSTVFRHYGLRYVSAPGGAPVERYLATNLSNLTFATNASQENWTVNITATDKFHNTAESSSTRIRLLRWPLHTINVSEIVVFPSDDPMTYPLTDTHLDTGINFTIRVRNETTGFFSPDQPNVTSNLALNWTTPKNVTKSRGPEFWIVKTVCRDAPDPTQTPQDRLDRGQAIVKVCNDALTDTDHPYSSFESVSVAVKDDEGGPGTYNFTIIIKDVSGQAREFNRTVKVNDAAPTILDKALVPSTVVPGESFEVRVNATDDVEVKAAYVNFTRSAPADGTYVNLTLYNASTHAIPGSSPPALWYWWNSTFQTGRHKDFGVGGTFGVNLSVEDGNDNWRTESLGTFVVTDQEPPQIDEASANPSVQEVGQNVTFTVRARDATNVTSYLRVLQGSLVVFPPNSTFDNPGVKMIEDASGNFSYSLNLTTEGEYTWVVDVVDSVGRSPGSRSGPLAFRDNLGPRFEMRSPSYVFEGQRYSGPLPRIEALVYDSEGVAASSVTMKVDNVTVSPTLLPAPAGANGFLVVYTVPEANRYHHRDVVTVNFTAIDNSTRQLGGFADFTFVVDDVAPIVRLVSVDPSYRARPTDPLNVSLATRFTLEAEDNDGLPTIADTITVQILGGGNNGEIVYTGPFKINDAPGVYTGPRVYSVQYWATDSVGNRNSTKNITTIFVDETPPTLFQYLPQGRFINATFIDNPVGVSRAVVWYRVNNDPYTPYSLTQDGDQWTTTLPEGKKGDRVSYYLQAWDRINNTATYGNATAPYANFDVGNHEPALRITSPIDGSRVSRTVDLRWNASDEDRDALVFTVSIKAPGSATYRELTKLENTEARRYTVDTSKYPDGEYTFRVAVSDGGFSRVSEVRLTIINQASPVGPVTVPSEAQPGDRILIKAQITKAQAVVEARLYLKGELVQAYPMNDDGRDGDEVANDGYYSVRVAVDSAGDYRVEIFTRYTEDGELKESSVVDAATFSAKLTPGYVLSEYAALIAGIALLAAVGIGVAVFIIVRRK